MATIHERKNSDGHKSYQAKIRIKGFPQQSKTFRLLTDAKRWAQQVEVALLEGRYFPQEQARKKTVGDLIVKYIDEILPLKPKSYRDQKQQLGYWQREIGDVALADVTSALISTHKNKLAAGKTSRGLRSKATVNRYLAAISHVFSIGVKEWGWLQQNPVSNVSRFKESRGRTRYLSDDERVRLLTACKKSENRYLYTIVVLALSSGARRNEILSLQWRSVDFDREVITLFETKNGEIRVIPIQGHALSLLKDLGRYVNNRNGYVFPSKITGKPMDIKKSWQVALSEAGVFDFRFHDLRHTAASYLAMNGASMTEISEILGHKTLAMVKRYAHFSEVHTKKIVLKMNERMFEND